MTPIDLYRRLLAALEGGYPPPPEVRDWFLDAAAAFEADSARSLCAHLGLRAPGRRSIATIVALASRDQLLRRAYAVAHRGNLSASPRERCRHIIEVVKRFERVRPRLPTPPAFPAADVLLFKAIGEMMRGGHTVPMSEEGILKALSKPSPGLFSW